MLDDTPRSLTVTDELLRAMTRDVTTALLRSPQALRMWAVFLGIGIPLMIVLAVVVGDPVFLVLYAGLMLVTVVVLAGVQWLATRRSVRRSLTVAFPSGTEVSLAVTDEGLQQRSVIGSSQTAWAAYRDLRVRGAAALLRVRGSSAVCILPSALLTDGDVDAIRARLG